MTTKDAKPKRIRARKPKPAAPAPQVETPAPEVADDPGTAEAPVCEPAAVPVAHAAVLDYSERFAELSRLVVFRMDGQRYALPIEAVQEIQQIVAISEMPGSSGAVLGVINLRGQVIPAIDMRLLVGLPSREPDLETPMILAYTSAGLVSLLVDEVEDVVEIPHGSMQAPSAVHALADRLLGVCMLEQELIFVFDMDAVLPPEVVSGVTT